MFRHFVGGPDVTGLKRGAVALFGALLVLAAVSASVAGAGVRVPVGQAAQVDGDLSEWGGASSTAITSQMVADAPDVKDDKDLSAQVYARRDAQNLYVAVNVSDDVLVFERSGGDIWQTDTVEVWIGNSQFGATLDTSGQAYLHSWQGADLSSAKIAVKKSAQGYAVEIAFPFSVLKAVLGQEIKAGLSFPFAVGIDDADQSGASREGQIYLPTGWKWGDTSTFTTATLE